MANPRNTPIDQKEEQDFPVSEYRSQPDSSGATGGVLGEQEYGIEDPEHGEMETAEFDVNGVELVSSEDPRGNCVIDPGASSEWSFDHGQGDSPAVREIGLKRTDQAILIDIEASFEFNDAFAGQQIMLGVHEGVVHLTGNVRSDSVKLRAQEICEAMPGVVEVRNELVVGAV